MKLTTAAGIGSGLWFLFEVLKDPSVRPQWVDDLLLRAYAGDHVALQHDIDQLGGEKAFGIAAELAGAAGLPVLWVLALRNRGVAWTDIPAAMADTVTVIEKFGKPTSSDPVELLAYRTEVLDDAAKMHGGRALDARDDIAPPARAGTGNAPAARPGSGNAPSPRPGAGIDPSQLEEPAMAPPGLRPSDYHAHLNGGFLPLLLLGGAAVVALGQQGGDKPGTQPHGKDLGVAQDIKEIHDMLAQISTVIKSVAAGVGVVYPIGTIIGIVLLALSKIDDMASAWLLQCYSSSGVSSYIPAQYSAAFKSTLKNHLPDLAWRTVLSYVAYEYNYGSKAVQAVIWTTFFSPVQYLNPNYLLLEALEKQQNLLNLSDLGSGAQALVAILFKQVADQAGMPTPLPALIASRMAYACDATWWAQEYAGEVANSVGMARSTPLTTTAPIAMKKLGLA